MEVKRASQCCQKMKKARILISGFVQGVGFRQFIRKEAEDLDITGWVRNTPNNKVEALLQGEEDNVEQLIAICRNGPFLAEVKDIEIEWVENEEVYREFRVIRD